MYDNTNKCDSFGCTDDTQITDTPLHIIDHGGVLYLILLQALLDNQHNLFLFYPLLFHDNNNNNTRAIDNAASSLVANEATSI